MCGVTCVVPPRNFFVYRMNHSDVNFIPNYGVITELLMHLNSKELNELLNNGDKLHTLIEDSEQVKEIEAEREMLIARNKSLSDFNLSKKPILMDYHQKLEQLHALATELKSEILRKKKELGEKKGNVSADVMLALLQAATVEIEDESEVFAERFLNGNMSSVPFLEEYLEKRKLYHLRSVKSEKLKKLLSEQDKHCRGINITSLQPLQAHRKPPAPPVPGIDLSHLTKSYSPSNGIISSVLTPTRQAPHPPGYAKNNHLSGNS